MNLNKNTAPVTLLQIKKSNKKSEIRGFYIKPLLIISKKENRKSEGFLKKRSMADASDRSGPPQTLDNMASHAPSRSNHDIPEDARRGSKQQKGVN